MRPENEPCRLVRKPNLRLVVDNDEIAGERAVEDMNRSRFWNGVFQDFMRPVRPSGDAL